LGVGCGILQRIGEAGKPAPEVAFQWQERGLRGIGLPRIKRAGKIPCAIRADRKGTG